MTNTTIGEQLRKARIAQGRDLSQIADETKISKYYLEAIEGNQIDRLPGLFFYKAFVRQYSRILNVDSKKLEAQINAEHGAPEVGAADLRESRIPVLRQPALRAANSIAHDMRLVFAGIGLIVFLVGGSMVYTWIQRPAPTVITESKPVYVPAPEGKGAPAMTFPSEGTGRASQGASSAQPQPTSLIAMGGIRAVSDNLTPNATADSTVALSLSATEPTWITITSDGKTVFTGVLEAQQSKSLAGKQKVMIKVGNAAGLEVKWNGKQVGRLGESKQVRTILFTDKNYEIVQPPPSATVANPVSD